MEAVVLVLTLIEIGDINGVEKEQVQALAGRSEILKHIKGEQQQKVYYLPHFK